MTTEQARQHLEAAERGLNAALSDLIAMKSNRGQLQVRLQEAAEAVKKVYDGRSSFRPAPSIASLARSIRASAARAQLLLDAAVNLYCGSLTAAMSQCCPYTPAGELPRRIEGSYLRVEA